MIKLQLIGPRQRIRQGVLIFMLAAGLALPGAGLCRSDNDEGTTQKHLTLEEILVTGHAGNEAMSTEVGIKRIEKGKNITIPDVIKTEPDIDLKRRTLVGDTTDSLSIRGFSGNRIMLNINGRPVNASGVVGGYYIDWGTVPLDNIEKIELIRGGSSVRYGNNALGGVVNVITKDPTTDPTLTLFGTYGGGEGIHGIENFRITHTYKVGPLGYSLAGSYQEAEPYLWNDDFEGRNLAATVSLDMPLDGKASFGFQYANSQRGFIRTNRVSEDPYDANFYTKLTDDYPLAFGETFSPYSGMAYTPGPGAYWDKTKYYLDFGYSQPIADLLVDFKIYKNIEDRKEKNYSSSALNGSYADGVLVLERDVASDRSYGGSLEVSTALASHELLAGVDHKVLAYGDVTTNYVDLVYNNVPRFSSAADLSYKNTSEGISWGYYVQDTWAISDRWLLTGGFRYDRYKTRSINGGKNPGLSDDGVTPKLTGTFQVSPADIITASVYQALRTPGLPETFWWGYGATKGNPILKPEKNTAVEFLYRHNFAKQGFLRMSAYHYDVDDYIVSRFTSTWKGVYNLDKAEIYGASLDGGVTFTDRISGTTAVTFQRSEKEGDIYDTSGLSDEIDYLPKWKVSAGLEFKLPRESVLNVTARYVGERSAIHPYTKGFPPQQHFTRVDLDAYVTADVNFKMPLGKHTEFSCYVENLFDKEYEERYGYPMPGIIAGAAIKFSL